MGYRRATLEDVPILCAIRNRQLLDEGFVADRRIDTELDEYFAKMLGDGSLVEWLFEEDGEVVATAAILFLPFPPTFANPQGVRGYVTNMYTAPSHRRRGIATHMLGLLADEARERGVPRLFLSSSKMGHSVYESFGFHVVPKFMEMDQQ